MNQNTCRTFENVFVFVNPIGGAGKALFYQIDDSHRVKNQSVNC